VPVEQSSELQSWIVRIVTMAVCNPDPVRCKQSSTTWGAPAMKRMRDVEKHTGKTGISLRQGTIVPRYDVFAVCNACGDAHSTGISIYLEGPVKRRTIAEAYRGKHLPSHLATLKQERVYCPNLGRHYPQTDYRQIFLVPSAEQAGNARGALS
jgi:hypothetical protein